MKPISTASPHAIIMVGIPGSGKSMFAEQFADTFQAPIVSQTSLQREYRLSDKDALSLRDFILNEYIKMHRTILIDGGMDSKVDRDDMVKRLKRLGYRPLVVWVQTDTSESMRRAVKPYPKGSGLTPEQFDALVDMFDSPHEKEKAVVISGKHTYKSQLRIVLKQIVMSGSNQSSQGPASTAASAPATIPVSATPSRSQAREVFKR